MEWFFIEAQWEGKPLLIQRAFHTREEAEQSAARETSAGVYRILSYPTRDKRTVWRLWRAQQGMPQEYPSPY